MDGSRKRPRDIYASMRESIDLVQPGGSKNNPNTKSTGGAVLMTVSAAVSSASNRIKEQEEARKETSYYTKVFTIRYVEAADNHTLTVRYRSEDYDIEDINDKYGDRSFLEITATRRR